VAVGVAVGAGEAVAVAVAVAVRVGVAVAVRVGVGLAVGVRVGVAEGVGVGEAVGEGLGVGVGVVLAASETFRVIWPEAPRKPPTCIQYVAPACTGYCTSEVEPTKSSLHSSWVRAESYSAKTVS
jgi:hypothetical protein